MIAPIWKSLKIGRGETRTATQNLIFSTKESIKDDLPSKHLAFLSFQMEQEVASKEALQRKWLLAGPIAKSPSFHQIVERARKNPNTHKPSQHFSPNRLSHLAREHQIITGFCSYQTHRACIHNNLLTPSKIINGKDTSLIGNTSKGHNTRGALYFHNCNTSDGELSAPDKGHRENSSWRSLPNYSILLLRRSIDIRDGNSTFSKISIKDLITWNHTPKQTLIRRSSIIVILLKLTGDKWASLRELLAPHFIIFSPKKSLKLQEIELLFSKHDYSIRCSRRLVKIMEHIHHWLLTMPNSLPTVTNPLRSFGRASSTFVNMNIFLPRKSKGKKGVRAFTSRPLSRLGKGLIKPDPWALD